MSVTVMLKSMLEIFSLNRSHLPLPSLQVIPLRYTLLAMHGCDGSSCDVVTSGGVPGIIKLLRETMHAYDVKC